MNGYAIAAIACPAIPIGNRRFTGANDDPRRIAVPKKFVIAEMGEISCIYTHIPYSSSHYPSLTSNINGSLCSE